MSPQRASLCTIALLAFGQAAMGQPTPPREGFAFGAFVDAYYAWDFGEPPTFDRSFAGGAPFTTQPARHNEFNANLAFVEAILTEQDLRARLAIQYGTSVAVNYAGEPSGGSASGPDLVRHIQEAVAGVRIGGSFWVDAGIYLSHVGMESWISRDNPTYTRSLLCDYSPYYQSGVRFSWSPWPALSAQLHVVNGWQNVSENNSGKGVGARIDWAPASGVTLSGYNLVSQEDGRRLRGLHGIGAKATAGDLVLQAQADLGMQGNSAANGRAAHWWGFSVIARKNIARSVALNARFERFDDDEQIVLETGRIGTTPNSPFRGLGESIGMDLTRSRAQWRTEVRAFQNSGGAFPRGASATAGSRNVMVVTSLSMTLH